MFIKNISVAMVMLLTSQVVSAETLRSKSLKKQICSEIYSRFYRDFFNEDKCNDGTAKVTKKVKNNINGTNWTTRMSVTSGYDDVSFEVIVQKPLTYNSEGQVKLGKWEVISVHNPSLGEKATLLKANPWSKNIKEVYELDEIETLPEAVRKWESEFADAPSFEVGEATYYKVYKTE